MWKGVDSKKTKRLTHEEVKKQLIKLMVVNDFIEVDVLIKKAEEVQDPEEAATIIKNMKTSFGPRRKEL